MIRTLEFRGNSREIAEQIGNLFKKHLQSIEPRYLKMLEKEEVKSAIDKLWLEIGNDPLLLSETEGRAEGAGINKDAMLLILSPELYGTCGNCTTLIMKKKNGEFLLSHNEDDRGFSEDNTALIRYNFGNRWLTAYTNAERLCGCFFGWNSSGMAFSSNAISAAEKYPDRISRYMLERKIMETKSVGEAITVTKSIHPASAFSINILDIENRVAVNVERDLDECYVSEITDRYARSNHFLKKGGKVDICGNSLFRYQNSEKLIEGLDSETAVYTDLRKILSYRTKDYLESTLTGDEYQSNANGNMTVANFSVDTETKMIYLRDYIGKHDFCFDFYKGI